MSLPYHTKSPPVGADAAGCVYTDAWHSLAPARFAEWAKKACPPKPKLRAGASGTRLYHALVSAAAHLRFAADLPSVASDYMDGLYVSADAAVKQLLAVGVLEEVPVELDRTWRSGQTVTWHLTPYACAVFLAYSPVPPVRIATDR